MDRSREKNKGITLVELLVSMAIMGLVASMISVIMVNGSNFFRRQGSNIDLQNDSQLITASMTTAILEGTGFTLLEEDVAGKTVLKFDTGKKCYVWVEDSAAEDNGYLYIYDTGAAIDFNKGNCLCQFVVNFEVTGKAVRVTNNADGTKSYTYMSVESASKVDSIYVEFTLANTQSEVKQNFEIKPRNTSAGYEKLTESGH